MPAVARKIAADLSALQPVHRRYFAANLRAFDSSLRPWLQAIAQFRAAYPRVPVAVTEPVGDALLQAAGANDLTPFGLQADVMNGVDPSPQDVALQDNLFAKHRVRVLLYNQQVVDSLTRTFLAAAGRNGVPVVGVYETMPSGFTYQSWMLAETRALFRAVASGKSEQRL
jgi:zinc/manganese transport system substrate-binding protein